MHPHQHQHDLAPFRHSHAFGDAGEAARGRALLAVTVVTLVTMAIELAAGWWTGSLALTADGWHMGTHAAALGGAVLAMRWSRRARSHEGFAFGGWKIEVLSAYTSALLLAAVAAGLAVEAVQHLISPPTIGYAEAMVVAVLGLAVNLASVWLLARGGHDHHGHAHAHAHAAAHDHGNGHGHDHGDHGRRRADGLGGKAHGGDYPWPDGAPLRRCRLKTCFDPWFSFAAPRCIWPLAVPWPCCPPPARPRCWPDVR